MSAAPWRRVVGSAPYGIIPQKSHIEYNVIHKRRHNLGRLGLCSGVHDMTVIDSPQRIDKSQGYRLSLSCGHQQGSPRRLTKMRCYHCA